MSPFKVGLATTALIAAMPLKADEVQRWQPLIDHASKRCGVSAEWIARVMRAESAGMTTLDGRPLISRAGAMGLMQLMPGTWADMRSALGLSSDPHDPRDNIIAGACYLRLMHDHFGYPGMFAAYNAGPARYADYLAGRAALPAETRAYLVTVGGAPSSAPAVAARAPDRSIFFVRTPASETPVQARASAPANAPGSIFVTLTGVNSENR